MTTRRPMTKINQRVRQRLDNEADDAVKTASMLRLERKHSRLIQELLRSGTGDEVALELGVTKGCVSKWRKLFRIHAA
jgi:hypothetical protein